MELTEDTDNHGLRHKLATSTEEILGRIVQDLLENPVINGALARAFEARAKATQAQEVAMGALNIPSAADVDRLTRRLRSASQRLEGLEETVQRLDEAVARLTAEREADSRLESIEEQLTSVSRTLEDLGAGAPAAATAVSSDQERLAVEPGEPS